MPASLRKILIIVGTIGLFSWGCGGDKAEPTSTASAPAGTPETARPKTGDDRPPIIISDGSVDMFIDAGPKGRGQWVVRDAATGRQWYHEPPSGALTVTSFDLTLLNTKKNSTAPCSEPDHVYSVKTFALTFSGLGGGKADASIDGSGNFQIDFESEAKKDDVYAFWLNTGGLKHLKTITLTEKGAKTPTTCEFGGGHRGIIKVRQIH